MKFSLFIHSPGASQVALVVKNHLPMQETWETLVWSLGQKDILEEGMATHSSILAWRIPWTEEPGRQATVLRAAKSQRQLKQLSTHTFIHLPKSERESVTCSVISNSVIPSAIACQAPLSMEFSRQEYWKSPHLLKDILFAFKFWQLWIKMP